MSRILYVEDKLEQYKDMILEMFEPILTSEKIEELDRFRNPMADNIVKWSEDIPLLDICYTFTDALHKIIQGHDKYWLVIIDRNLEAYRHEDDYEEIEQLLKENDLPEYKSYSDDFRSITTIYQGDILFQILLEKNPKSIDKVFFLTENLKDPLQVKPQLVHEWKRLKYDQNRWIGKDLKSLEAITDEVKKLDSIDRLRHYPEVVNILKTIDEDCLDSFERILTLSGSFADVSALAQETRKLLLNVLTSLSISLEKNELRSKLLLKAYEEKNRKKRDFCFWIPGTNHELNTSDLLSALQFISPNDMKYFEYYSNIHNACRYIYHVCSDIGDHDTSKGIKLDKLRSTNATRFTSSNLVGLLCEVIIWYDRLLKQIEK